VKTADMLRSGEPLTSFVAYCVEHPHERFWQALRNWSGYTFIFAQQARSAEEVFEDLRHGLIDTFNIENKRHDQKS
jgi:hypothetical protein